MKLILTGNIIERSLPICILFIHRDSKFSQIVNTLYLAYLYDRITVPTSVENDSLVILILEFRISTFVNKFTHNIQASTIIRQVNSEIEGRLPELRFHPVGYIWTIFL